MIDDLQKQAMNIGNYFSKFVLAALILLAAASFSIAQNTKLPNPRQEKLLNNLKVLMWQDATADKVTVKLRVHSGAAFDTLGKEGTMAMLADALFPNESVKEFFRDDLGGSLAVESNYDYIQITATGNPDQILTILETAANAVTKPTLDKETTAKVKTARLERIKELEKNPAYVADLAVAKRLFGDYPYGRSAEGTPESLAKIDFADLILAKQRFLTADNATVAVSGNIKYDYVFKAVRQLFGGWEKADKKVPATFAQPNTPERNVLIVESQEADKVESREAVRGFARGDKDFFASEIFIKIVKNRSQEELSNGLNSFIRQDAHFLSGSIISGYSYSKSELESNPVKDRKVLRTPALFFMKKFTAEEFEVAKSELLTTLNQKNTVDFWLDLDSYRLISVKEEMAKLSNVTLNDVQNINENLKKQPVAEINVRSK